MTPEAATHSGDSGRSGLTHGSRVAVVSHKECWIVGDTVMSTGGFPAQMDAVAELAQLHLVVPVVSGSRVGGAPVDATELTALAPLIGVGARRRLQTMLWLARIVPKIIRAVRKADLVYCLVPGDVGAVGMLLAALLRRPLVIRHCGTWGRRDTLAERLTMFLLERLASRHVVFATGWSREPPSTAAPSVEWIFSASLRSGDLTRVGHERHVPVKGVRLVTAGRQVRQKGTDCVLHSLSRMLHDGRDISLDVIGDGSDLGGFRQTARDLGLAPMVRFHGRVAHEEVVKIMESADIFVFPTTSNEGFPKVVAEAMACGLPVVATPVSALRTIVPGAGALIPNDDPDALAEAVGILLDDPDLYARASVTARVRAAEFTIEGWQDRFVGGIDRRYPGLGLGGRGSTLASRGGWEVESAHMRHQRGDV